MPKLSINKVGSLGGLLWSWNGDRLKNSKKLRSARYGPFLVSYHIYCCSQAHTQGEGEVSGCLPLTHVNYPINPSSALLWLRVKPIGFATFGGPCLVS